MGRGKSKPRRGGREGSVGFGGWVDGWEVGIPLVELGNTNFRFHFLIARY